MIPGKIVKVRDQSGSKMLAIPSEMFKKLKLKVGQDVVITMEGKTISINLYEEKEKNISLECIYKDLESKCNANIKTINYVLENQYNNQSEDIKRICIKNMLAMPNDLYGINDNLSLGIIESNKKNDIFINEKKLEKKVKEIFDNKFFYNLEELEVK